MTIRLNLRPALTLASLLCLGAMLSTGVCAQTVSGGRPTAQQNDATPSVHGTTLDKKTFSLAALKGKVVLVMFWSTDCAVCRDKMPELRENVQGWAGKPFELVLISVDKRMSDVESYNAIINKSVPLKQRFTQLWTGDPAYKDNLGSSALARSQLPTTLLLDKQGKQIERFNGRIPADVWDKIADLL